MSDDARHAFTDRGRRRLALGVHAHDPEQPRVPCRRDRRLHHVRRGKPGRQPHPHGRDLALHAGRDSVDGRLHPLLDAPDDRGDAGAHAVPRRRGNRAVTPDRDPLAFDAEAMRQLGYRTVDVLVDWLQRESPPLRRASPAEMRERLGGPPPEQAEPFDEILAGLERDVLPFGSRDGHPSFFGFVPFASTWPGALGDLIASACNLYVGSWLESAGASQVELEVLGWFKDWIGYPQSAAGSLVSGGSAGNMTALACARATLAGPMRDDLVLYVSDQGHSSIARAARILGFRPEQLRVLPSDTSFRLAPET